MEADLCIHVANIVYLGSYLVRDVLWLRILTVCGLSLAVAFFCMRLNPTSAPVFWHAVFVGVNIVQIGRLMRQRRAAAKGAHPAVHSIA